MPTGHYADVIERLKPGAAEAGEIVDLDGQVLGAHYGIIHFTVGQRRGLGFATGAPLYVVRLDAERAPRRGRPARGAAHEPHRAARRQLDRRRQHRRGARRRPARGVREGAFDAAAAAGLAAAGRRRLSRSNWSTARMAFRPVRPASSTTPPRARRACSAAASSRARWRRPTARCAADRPRLAAAAARGLRRRAGEWGRTSTSDSVERAYARWAPIYDLVFGAVFEHGRSASIAAAERDRRAHSRSRRRHRHFAAGLCAHQPSGRRRPVRADAAQGAGARRRARPAAMSKRWR